MQSETFQNKLQTNDVTVQNQIDQNEQEFVTQQESQQQEKQQQKIKKEEEQTEIKQLYKKAGKYLQGISVLTIKELKQQTGKAEIYIKQKNITEHIKTDSKEAVKNCVKIAKQTQTKAKNYIETKQYKKSLLKDIFSTTTHLIKSLAGSIKKLNENIEKTVEEIDKQQVKKQNLNDENSQQQDKEKKQLELELMRRNQQQNTSESENQQQLNTQQNNTQEINANPNENDDENECLIKQYNSAFESEKQFQEKL